MRRISDFNYADLTPENSRDLVFLNNMDAEEFDLFGAPLNYYCLSKIQENYDPAFRDFSSSPQYDQPVQVRGFIKIDELTTTEMSNEIGMIGDRSGVLELNISKIEHDIGRPPIISDVIGYTNSHQKFIIKGLSKSLPRLGRNLRYKCNIQLYQDSL